jgi:hypothetical protein
VEDAILPAVESCSSPLRYFALYSDETLETLNVGSGPVALGPCPDALEPCCVAAPLPTQSTETLYFADVGASEQGQRFQPIGPEGPFLSAENYQRDCQCPAMKSRAFILGDGSGQRSYAAVNGAGRVVLAMYRAEDETGACEETGTCGVLYESEIYATTPEELQREGPPRVPYVRLARSGVGSVALSEDGIVYLGFIDRSEVLFGPLGGELETLPISIEGDSSHLVALNPASAGAPEFAVASEAGPDAIRVYREGEWQALATNARDGATCAPNDDQQRSGLIFTPRGDLLFMPHGVGYRVRTEITPETATASFAFEATPQSGFDHPTLPTTASENSASSRSSASWWPPALDRSIERAPKAGWTPHLWPAPGSRSSQETGTHSRVFREAMPMAEKQEPLATPWMASFATRLFSGRIGSKT